jgi:hypothetical protein
MSPDSSSTAQLDVVRLWQLPSSFFTLPLDLQWEAMKQVTVKASALSKPRAACAMGFVDEAMCVAFFLITLGLPWLLAVLGVALVAYGTRWNVGLFVLFVAILALHPLPKYSLHARSSRLSLALIQYFTFEILVDRSNPILAQFGTSAVDGPAFQATYLPALYLACPHGVFNYGAIAWCCISRWFCGCYQYTGGADAVASVPGLRYLDMLIWLISADRKTIKRALQERGAGGGAALRGGMLGMVPDGILGAFRSRPGVDELIIGKKRGLMRICLEEGTTVFATWFFGTTDLLTGKFKRSKAKSRLLLVPLKRKVHV